MNLMIHHFGAFGDAGFLIPALIELRKRYDELYLFGRGKVRHALEGTRLIDKFIIPPENYDDMNENVKRKYLLEETADIDFQARLVISGVVPGRYVFHLVDGNSKRSREWKIENARGVIFFDEYSKAAESPEAIGKRPRLFISYKERKWLKGFRKAYGIPANAFLLGWQFTGSSPCKWYPYFDEVVQKGIMTRYANVYLVGLGDMAGELSWKPEYHGGRFINLGDVVSFREACLLTSSFDCFVSVDTGVFVMSQAFADVPKVLLIGHTFGGHVCCGAETEIIQSEAECSPCYNIVADCTRDNESGAVLCMAKIDPRTVIKAVERVIEKKGAY